MNNLRTIIVIAGILVAGLAFKSVAQVSTEPPTGVIVSQVEKHHKAKHKSDKDKSDKKLHKHDWAKEKTYKHGHAMKHHKERKKAGSKKAN